MELLEALPEVVEVREGEDQAREAVEHPEREEARRQEEEVLLLRSQHRVKEATMRHCKEELKQ